MKNLKTNNALVLSELIDKLYQMCTKHPNDQVLGKRLRSEISTIKEANSGD